jgi:adenosylcobinamide-GDP ribazoletransferase
MSVLTALLSSLWQDFVTVLGFLTRLPAPRPAAAVPLGRALRLAPLAGVVVGLTGALVFWAASALGLAPLLAGLLAVAATALATGALHEDGLADVADGFGGAFDRSGKLAIMRDSRTGAYGVLALVFSVGLRAGALAVLADPAAAAAALVGAHAASRGAFPAVMYLLAPARAEGLGAGAGQPGHWNALLGLGLALAVALVACGPGDGLVVFAVALLAAAFVALLARIQVGGYTGDVLGAVQQAAEAAALLGAAARL